MLSGNIKECDYLVSILNLCLNNLGYTDEDINDIGFGYDENGIILCIDSTLEEGLSNLWNEMCTQYQMSH